MQELSDHAWVISIVGDPLAETLWPHIDIAETARLIAVYGYAKDNAFPSSLRVRLRDVNFAEHLLASVVDEGTPGLLEAAQQLLDAALKAQSDPEVG